MSGIDSIVCLSLVCEERTISLGEKCLLLLFLYAYPQNYIKIKREMVDIVHDNEEMELCGGGSIPGRVFKVLSKFPYEISKTRLKFF